jgi:hypothetical protein
MEHLTLIAIERRNRETASVYEVKMTQRSSEFANRTETGARGSVGGSARMAVDGARRVFGQYAARAEGGRGDIPGLLRIRWRGLSAGETPHGSRIYRCPSEGRQEARDDTALCRNDLARAYGRPSPQSLFKRSRPVGIKEDGSRNLR